MSPRVSRLILIAILLLAAFLRLGWPQVVEFKYDEAATIREALALAQEGQWPSPTISSVAGIPQPPLKAYLLAVPLIFWPDPLAAELFQAALGVAAVWLTYRLASQYFSQPAGLIAALLYACAPWSVFFDRKLWAEELTIFTLAFMLPLYAFLIRRKFAALALILPAAAALIGLYTGNAVYVFMFGLALLLNRHAARETWQATPPKQRRRWIGIGLAAVTAIGAIGTASLWQSLKAVTQHRPALFDGTSSTWGFYPFRWIRYAAQAATGFEFHALAGDQWPGYYASLPLPNLNRPVDGLLVGLILAAMVYVVTRAIASTHRSPKEAAPYSLLALWIVIPTATWIATGMQPELHRFTPLYPSQSIALAVLVADGLDWLRERTRNPRLRPVWAGVLIAWLSLTAAWQVVEYVGMVRFVEVTRINEGHGPPARSLWTAAREVRRLAKEDGLPIVVYTLGDDPIYDQGAIQLDALLGDLHPVLVERGTMDVGFPSGYIWVDSDAGWSTTYEVHAPEPGLPDTPIVRFANGAELIAVDVPGTITPGTTNTVDLTWRLWGDPPAGVDIYQYTLRLLTAEGGTCAQRDGAFLLNRSWRKGAVITTPVIVDVAADAPADQIEQLEVGMYSLNPDGSFTGVDVLDVAGNPAGHYFTVEIE